MNLTDVDPSALRKSMRFALDLVAAHRIAKGLSLDQERITAVRDSLEERLAAAFGDVDPGSMPSTWSWSKAAETLAVEIALEIIREQKLEPPYPLFKRE